jgi:hypothetical protein
MPISQINTNSIANGAVVAADIADGAVTRAKMGYAGAVLQVVNAIKTDGFSASLLANQFASVTGLSASITPISSSSRILILASVIFSVQDSSYQSLGSVRIARGGTGIGVGSNGFTSAIASVTSADNFSAFASIPLVVFDAPNTTSPITYDVQVTQNITGGATRVVQVNRNRGGDVAGGASSLIIMEIAG